MKLKLKITIFFTIVLMNFFLINSLALAQSQQLLDSTAVTDLQAQDNVFLAQTGLSDKVSLAEVISTIIKAVLSFLGVILVILLIYGGFLWMTAAGNEESIAKAKKIIISAFIGLTIVLSAYVITYYVLDKILEATTDSEGLRM